MGHGRGKGRGKGGEGEAACAVAGCAIVVLLMIILLPATLRKVDATENALAYDTIWCNLKENTLDSGLKSIPAFGKLIRWPSTYQTVEYSSSQGSSLQCNSADGIQISLDVTFQFVPRVGDILELTLTYETFEKYQDILFAVGRSALRHACGDFRAQQFQTDRALVAQTMKDEVTSKLDEIMSDCIDVQLRNVDRPTSYENAVQAKEAARTDIDLATSERQQALTVADTELKDAELEANRTINAANTQARITESYGQNDADAVTDRYTTWTNTYKEVMREQNLTPEGILAYIGTRLVAAADSATIAMDAPAKTSWATVLDAQDAPEVATDAAATTEAAATDAGAGDRSREL